MEKDIPANLYQKCLILCREILEDVLHNMSIPVGYHGNILVPDLPDVTGFACHLWRSIVIFANGASSAWSCKHINMLQQVCCLAKCFSTLWSPKILNQVEEDWKRVSCHGNQFLYSRRCVACITTGCISLLSFNGLCCKLTEIALFI